MNEYRKVLAQFFVNIATIIFGGGILVMVMKDDTFREVNFWWLMGGMSMLFLTSLFIGLRILKKWS